MRLCLTLLLLALLTACGGAPAPTVQSSDVVAAFKSAGLEAETPSVMSKDDYGLAPMVAAEGTRFLIPSLGADAGGRVFTFTSEADRDKMKAYYDDLAKASAAFFSWTFVKGPVLVQITGDLPEAQARQYEAALMAMK